jgi:hypothetical protein
MGQGNSPTFAIGAEVGRPRLGNGPTFVKGGRMWATRRMWATGRQGYPEDGYGECAR